MRYSLLKLGFFALLLLLESCIEPFSPPEVNSDQNYLVVDGFLNVQDTTTISLRRTQNVNEESTFTIETGASLSVVGESGETFLFNESGPGRYILEPQQYNTASKYRLRIKTRNGSEYLSDYVAITVTPPIDSVTSKFDSSRDAMVFSINTHDAQNKTQFYRWKFEETWEYRSAYYSSIEVADNNIILRKNDINLCWGNALSGSILLGSTIKLSSAIIKDLPLFRVPVSTNKLFIKYSVLVRQYGLSREAFEYWTDLSKTTQGTGSLFDPQPSQVTGNIRSVTDSDDLVFGYFSASTEERKRLTIVPKLGNYARCTPPDTFDIVCNPLSDRQCALETSALLITIAGPPLGEYILGAPASCVDCRLEGGTTVKPSFW
ncbi:DUF4249 domain-containing protein [Dyadobacter arcticus]|uniref:DUF4249 domain-containing protein n=1 Tax=Dyadobacter arcticus TaxID=1078754 RepID=A0ABX0UH74_9BACT|nr:DUF4249 domain-containing protein [Dyadobacter arcticus]NIJ51369.1 hypothetical protein [Dyadobacter arcticus]